MRLYGNGDAMNMNADFVNSSVLIDGFPVYGFSSVEEAANWILSSYDRPNIAVALNAEKIITSRNEPGKFDHLKNNAFFYPDGTPVVWLLARRNIASARIPGVELWEAIMAAAGDRKVFLLGASEEVNRATAEKLRKSYGLTNLERRNGYFDDDQVIIDELAAAQPDIVTVAMGSPRQEEFMDCARKVCPNTFFMGVGGTYDVFTGRLPRAPLWMRKIGMEWLFRSLREPKRFLRNISYIHFMYLYVTRQI